jgi:predicted RNA polymerase sigma factor
VAAYARLGEAKTALAHLDVLPRAVVENHQPYWVARASVLAALGESAAAAAALDTAINHTADTHLRQHLRAKRTMLLRC